MKISIYKKILIALISFLVCLSVISYAEDGSSETELTDFSNAKYELKKEGNSFAFIEITGVTLKDNTSYYFLITNNSEKPTITTTELPKDAMYLTPNSNMLVAEPLDVTQYVEFNQDLYITIIEHSYDDYYYHIATYGNKLERFEEPKYADAFVYTFWAHNRYQISTLFTHSYKNNRKMQIKLGKVTDNSILQKLKNNNSSGFEDLLNYAKSNSAIYDQTIDINSNNMIDYLNENPNYINGIEDKAFYYLYVKMDDENGKYIYNEAVTLAQASAYRDGTYFMFFYGNEEINWGNYGGTGVGTSTSKGDTTVSNKILPFAGKNIALICGIILLFTSCIIFYKKHNYLKDIK